ncbi:hypothetical protein [Segetibacter koreensis]|uniref:hypothetical protein n=1 Tax=Segetibacter koreensis TaxID=398037 RepID=UPI0003794CBB|nr:hypothetical protein [Segetibacter koreensis]
MQPTTYSVAEIKSIIRAVDDASLAILQELVEEEKEGYTACELKAVYKFIEIKSKELIWNEVNVDFLLSFN